MALRKRNYRDDIRWLRWPIAVLVIAVGSSASLYVGASMYLNEVRRQQFNATTDLDLLVGQVDEIAASEQIVVNNIGIYNRMVANGAMGEEDRVRLLEEITSIRERNLLFPINVSIGEQDRLLLPYPDTVDFPDEQITLRTSQVQVRYSLLHEEDLTRFLDEYLSLGNLMVPSRCAVSMALEDPSQIDEVVQHQIAECNFNWYTFQREPYLGF